MINRYGLKRRTLSPLVVGFAALGLTAACTGGLSAPYTGPEPAPSPLVQWPTPSGNHPVDNPIWVNGVMDGKMQRFFGVDEHGTASQAEGQEPLFNIADGGTLKNAILGFPAADGIHCRGSCTLENVWWDRVGEDAATFRGQTDDDIMLIKGGGASGARDKVFQSNQRGTMIIQGFYVEWFGKLFRSCGNCSRQSPRHVIVENVTAVAGPDSDALVGVNINYGDTAEFRGVNTVYDTAGDMPVCLMYEGNNVGAEPKKLGEGSNGENCIRVNDNVNVIKEYGGLPDY